MIPSGRLQENFKFTVKVNNSHVYFQNDVDKCGSILTNPDNRPKEWLHNPCGEEIRQLKDKINMYEKEAKNIRLGLVSTWLEDIVIENKKVVGPVDRLKFVRKTRENVWPCQDCDNLSSII